MYRGSGPSVAPPRGLFLGSDQDYIPLSMTRCNQTSKEIDADLGFIWGAVIWRLSPTEETLKEDQEEDVERDDKGRGERWRQKGGNNDNRPPWIQVVEGGTTREQ